MKSPKDFAELVGIDQKTARRFLRSLTDERAGKGGRWDLSSIDPIKLVGAYEDYKSGRTVKLSVESLEFDFVDE